MVQAYSASLTLVDNEKLCLCKKNITLIILLSIANIVMAILYDKLPTKICQANYAICGLITGLLRHVTCVM